MSPLSTKGGKVLNRMSRATWLTYRKGLKGLKRLKGYGVGRGAARAEATPTMGRNPVTAPDPK